MHNLISCWELILVLQSQCLSGERPPHLVRAGRKFNNGSQRKLHSCHPTRVVFLSVHNPLHIHSNGMMQGPEVRRSLCCGGNLLKPRVSKHDFYFCHFPYTDTFLGRNPTAVTALQQRYLPDCTVWGRSVTVWHPSGLTSSSDMVFNLLSALSALATLFQPIGRFLKTIHY